MRFLGAKPGVGSVEPLKLAGTSCISRAVFTNSHSVLGSKYVFFIKSKLLASPRAGARELTKESFILHVSRR